MSPHTMSLEAHLHLLLEWTKSLTKGNHYCAHGILDLLDEINATDFGDQHKAAVSHLRNLAMAYWRCFARGEDGEPSEVSYVELASDIKMAVLKLISGHLSWKRGLSGIRDTGASPGPLVRNDEHPKPPRASPPRRH